MLEEEDVFKHHYENITVPEQLLLQNPIKYGFAGIPFKQSSGLTFAIQSSLNAGY